MLPVPIPRTEVSEGGKGAAAIRPELEFIFRTLVDLRVDMDDLRREFEVYRRGEALDLPAQAIVGTVPVEQPSDGGIEIGPYSPREPEERDVSVEYVEPTPVETEGTVIYRSGMTIEDMERQAIEAALAEVAGNRRKAAELLGIGERTLYRKIKEYGL